MTDIQVRYWEHKENQRSHLANEAENYRSHRASENLSALGLAETQRSNLAREAETNRHNQATERETNRSNLVNESLKRESNQIDWHKAESQRRTANSNVSLNDARRVDQLNKNVISAADAKWEINHPTVGQVLRTIDKVGSSAGKVTSAISDVGDLFGNITSGVIKGLKATKKIKK